MNSDKVHNSGCRWNTIEDGGGYLLAHSPLALAKRGDKSTFSGFTGLELIRAPSNYVPSAANLRVRVGRRID